MTTRSKRSSSARESLSRNAASRCGEHEHSAAGSPRPPHGHRFIVATSWKRAGKSACPCDPRDRDDAVLERLPQRLERRPLELGQLVEQQDAAMREARLARTRAGAAADDRGGRGAVVRRAERRRRDQRPLGRQHAGDRVDPHHLERLARLERRQDRRQPPRRASSCPCRAGRRAAGCGRPPPRARARAARAPGRGRRRGRAASGSGSLVAAARPAAAAARRAGTRPPRRGAGPGSPRPRRAPPRTPTRARRGSARARCAALLRRRRTRRAPAGRGRRARARRRRRARRAARRDLPRRREHRQRDREVEARALLAQRRPARG